MCIRDRIDAVDISVATIAQIEPDEYFAGAPRRRLDDLGLDLRICRHIDDGALRHIRDPQPVSYTHLDVYKRQVPAIRQS